MYGIAASRRGKQTTCNQKYGFIVAYRVNMEQRVQYKILVHTGKNLKSNFKVCDSLPMMGKVVNTTGNF
jgi:hypothetical protein